MGRATRWLRGLLGMRKEKEPADNPISGGRKEKKRWGFGKRKSGGDSTFVREIPSDFQADKPPGTETAWLTSYIADADEEQNKHSIAVAVATAAAANAAVAAAQAAAAAVVRLTCNGRGALFYGGRDKWAAVKIQAVFRGYLARKALRALRGLVKLQALVRGSLVRKRANATLHSMQELRAPRLIQLRTRRCIQHSQNGFHESPKVVDIDTYYKPRPRSHQPNLSKSDFGTEDPFDTCPIPAHLSYPDSRRHRGFEWNSTSDDEYKCSTTAQSTPRFANLCRSNGPPTPAKSVCGDSFLGPRARCYLPSYMTNTQSFRAKQRSHSAPKQRPQPGSKKRLSRDEIMASRSSLSSVRMQQSCSHVEEVSEC